MAMGKDIKSKPLTGKQVRFCDEYIKDCNAKWAAVRAGYSERSAKFTGHDNLKKPLIKRIIAEKKKELARCCRVDTERILRETVQIAFSNIGDYLSVGEGGRVVFKDFDQIPADKLAAVESVRVRRSGTKLSIVSLKLHSKTEALEKLFKRFGLYKTDNEQKAPHSLADILALISAGGEE